MTSDGLLKQAKEQLPAACCSLALLVVILIAHPVGEVPFSDDVSFIFSAKVLARTGHIVYNGFVSPILGWQLYWGALFLRLFGDSFHVARVSISVLALFTVYLCQRTMERAGIRPWNAVVGTLVLALTPMFAIISIGFLTDIPALFAILVCLYACLRTLEAHSSRAAIGWIGFATLSNVLLGSVRQTAWMGVLVMVPSLLWLMRRRGDVFRAGVAFLLASVVMIAAMMHWFAQQPWTMKESLLPPGFTPHVLLEMVLAAVHMVLQVGLFLLPLLIVFLPALFRKRTPWVVYVLGGALLVSAVLLGYKGQLQSWGAPYLGRSFWWPFGSKVSLGLTAVIVLCLLALLKDLMTREVAGGNVVPYGPGFRKLLLLVVPFGVSNAALLVLRGGFTAFWDRYTLPLLLIALLLLLRYDQQQGRGRVPVIALIAALVYGGYATAIVHDDFAARRAALAAADEVEARGIPRTEITGDWDYDELTELMIAGHVYAPRMRLPKGESIPPSTHYGIADCKNFSCDMFPHVLPKYALSRMRGPGSGEFPPVSFHTWLLPAGTMYVVRFP
jgi:hypothetical protein